MHSLLASVLLLLSASAPPDYDVVLANGRVIDGTGAPWFRADVGIRGDRIEAIGDLSKASAGRRIDVADKMVAPGFIDMLGQSALLLLVDNRVESKIRQGFTTEITGEGGSVVAPLNEAVLGEWKPFLDRYRLVVDWSDFTGYARRFEKSGSTLNVASFIGATRVRQLVLGFGDVQPTAEQLAAMEALTDQALAQGAVGVSSALIYPPATYAGTEELIALARVAARRGGIYATHIRSEADDEMAALDEAIRIGREAEIPVEIWHLKVSGRNNWGGMKDVLARIERARAEGVDVTANMYPYAAAQNNLAYNIPAWAQAGGTEEMLKRFNDPAQRARIKAELWQHGGLGQETPDGILLTYSPVDVVNPYLGKRLSAVAQEMGRSPEDALLDLLALARGQLGVVRFVMSEEDVQLGLRQPWVSICTDATGQALDGSFAGEGAHPRAFGSAPRLLGHYARDLALFSQEEAVRKMTSLPARRMRLWDRGILRPGMAADVTVFDAEKVRDVATYEDSLAYSEGIEYVLVNGKVVLDGGKLTAERPGRFLARP